MVGCSDLASPGTSVSFSHWEIPGQRTQPVSFTPRTNWLVWMQTTIAKGFKSGPHGTTGEGPCARVARAGSLTTHIFGVKQVGLRVRSEPLFGHVSQLLNATMAPQGQGRHLHTMNTRPWPKSRQPQEIQEGGKLRHGVAV